MKKAKGRMKISQSAAKIPLRPYVSKLKSFAKKTIRPPKKEAPDAVFEKNKDQTAENPAPLISDRPSNSVRQKSAEPEFEIKKTKIKIIGIGGGGCNIVSEISSRVKKASFAAANTDSAALNAMSDKMAIFQFGEKFTHGLGTGMDAQVGEEAAREEKEKIKKMIEGNDLVILVSSLGGGAGSGAVSVFAQVSKSLGIMTFGIFTLPFAFEGAKKKEIASAALERVRPYLNALTILPNERVFTIVPKTTPFAKTLSYINKTLSDGLEGLIETIYEPGLINIDFADLRTILSGQGKLAFLNSVDFKKAEVPGLESIEEVLNSPLFPYNVEKAKGILLNIVGEKDLKLSEVNQILNGIQQKIHKDAKIIFGVSQPTDVQKTFRVTILATGCVSRDIDKNDEPPAPKKQNEAKREPVPAKKPAIKKDLLKPKEPIKKKSLKKKADKAVSKPQTSKGAKKAAPLEPPQKTKVKVQNAPKTPSSDAPKIEEKLSKEWQKPIPPAPEIKIDDSLAVRKNAIQVKKEMEQEEKEMLEKEKMWDIPAFLRKRPKDV